VRFGGSPFDAPWDIRLREEVDQMRKRTAAAALFVLGLAATTPTLLATPAVAHEERPEGKYTIAVGFGDEPAYAGQKNSVQMFIHDANDNPVTDLGDTLQVEVSFGDQTMPAMTLEPNFEVGEFGIPGDYRAFFFPTRPGDYTFHITGTIKGQKIDESFTSSPSTFSSVEDPAKVQFPAKDPSTGELAVRLTREIPRVRQSAATAAQRASDESDSAKTLGLIGIIVGAVGVVVGSAALVTARRRSAVESPPARASTTMES
jgi:hypothetical protein